METSSKEKSVQTGKNLGTLRLLHGDTKTRVLVPVPSDDPNDPLNWTQAYKLYIAFVTSIAIFTATYISAGPAITIVDQALFFNRSLSKVAYFFTTTSLLMGVSNIIWIPMAVKYGRRIVYIASFAVFTAATAWAGAARTYESELAARIFIGVGSGAAEVLGPLTIADCFFLHQRGTMMVLYTCMLNLGSGIGSVIDGMITRTQSWRVIYWVNVSLVGFCFLLMIFTFPETHYVRNTDSTSPRPSATGTHIENGKNAVDIEHIERNFVLSWPRPSRNYRLWPSTVWTQESFWKLSLRPLALLSLPAVLWATLVMSVSIGFLVAISSNLPSAFAVAYGMGTWQSGLCYTSTIIGAVIAIFFGGTVSDWTADYFTRRNNGIREPEMRLPAMGLSVITGPLSLILYGVGIEYRLHWICPTFGLGLLVFTIVLAANISLVYMVDCYRPITGEVMVAEYAFKSLFGFLLSFYTNPWVDKMGYARAFGIMAGINGAVLIGVVPLYFYGKALRRKSWNWPITRKLVRWDDDREVGE